MEIFPARRKYGDSLLFPFREQVRPMRSNTWANAGTYTRNAVEIVFTFQIKIPIPRKVPQLPGTLRRASVRVSLERLHVTNLLIAQQRLPAAM